MSVNINGERLVGSVELPIIVIDRQVSRISEIAAIGHSIGVL